MLPSAHQSEEIMGLFDLFRTGRKASALEELRTGSPDPAFVGDFLAYCFVDRHFNLPESDMNALVTSVQDSLRPFALFWINVYLCWVLRTQVRAKHGDALFAAAFEAARLRLARGGAATANLADGLGYWFTNLDEASRRQVAVEPVEGIPIPMEVLAAWAFLALTPESPFFRQTEIPNDVALDLAAVLERANAAASKVITTLVEVGGPLRPGAV